MFPAVAEKAGGGQAAATVRLALRAPLAMLNQPIHAQWIVWGRGGGAVTRALELTLQ